MDFRLQLDREDHEPLVILHMRGSLAQLEVYKFKSTIDKLLGEGNRFFVLDLVDLIFIDSAGIGALAQARTEIHKVGGAMALVASTSRQVKSSISTSQLQKLVSIFETVAAAQADYVDRYGLAIADANGHHKEATAPEASFAGVAELILARLEAIDERLSAIEAQMNQAAPR